MSIKFYLVSFWSRLLYSFCRKGFAFTKHLRDHSLLFGIYRQPICVSFNIDADFGKNFFFCRLKVEVYSADVVRGASLASDYSRSDNCCKASGNFILFHKHRPWLFSSNLSLIYTRIFKNFNLDLSNTLLSNIYSPRWRTLFSINYLLCQDATLMNKLALRLTLTYAMWRLCQHGCVNWACLDIML